MDFTVEDPGAGDPGKHGSLATKLEAEAESIATAMLTLQKTVEGINAYWQGEAAGTALAGVSQQHEVLTLLHSVAVTSVAAIRAYQGAHSSVKEQATQLIASRESCASAMQAAERQVARYAVSTDADAVHQLEIARRALRTAKDGHAHAVGKLKGLFDERVTARNVYVQVRGGLVPAGWPAQRAAYKTIGVDPLKASAKQIADALAKYAEKHCGDRPLSPEVVKSLSALLSSYGDDAAVMAEFYRRLGGAKTAELIGSIDSTLTDSGRNTHDLSNKALLDLAALLREGLAEGSKSWTPDQARVFAKDLLSKRDYDMAAGYLFSGPPYLGPELAAEAADIVDRLERAGHPLVALGGSALIRAAGGPQHEGMYAAADLSGRILETLGQYPENAAAFLTDPIDGSKRVEYWFGKRDWSAGDQFVGPSMLLLGAQQAAGGPGDPAGGYDKSVWDKIALATSAALNALGKNKSFGSTTINDAASVNLAGVIAINLPGLTEYPINAKFQTAKYPNAIDAGLLGSDDKRAIPAISAEALSRLLGIVGKFSGGATVLAHAADAYEQALAAAAKSPSDLAKAMDRVAVLDAMIHGAIAGTDLADAQRMDAYRREQLDQVLALIGSIPVPGLSTLLGGANAVVKGITDFVQSYGTGRLECAAGGAVIGNESSSVLAQNLKDKAAQQALANYKSGMFLAEALGIPVTGLGDRPSVKQMTDWYRKYHDELSDKLKTIDPNGELNLDKIARDWEMSYGSARDDTR